MSAKHTPGPWELRSDDMGGLSSLIYPVGSESPTASVTGYYSSRRQTLPNARLIAAAPELLEALTDALCALEVADKQYVYVIDKARAAIAKVTGSAA